MQPEKNRSDKSGISTNTHMFDLSEIIEKPDIFEISDIFYINFEHLCSCLDCPQ